MNQIVLEPILPTAPTAYRPGGETRTPNGQVPHITEVMTVHRSGSARWKLSPASAESWALLLAAVLESGGELPRLVDAHRTGDEQALARQKFEFWKKSGEPEPGSARFNARTMKKDYVAVPDGSNHQWGGAVDIDVGALAWPDTGRGTNAALARFWDIADEFGWKPVILFPKVNQSECWHFDHWGSLVRVLGMFHERGHRADAYTQTARAGCALAGQLHSENTRQSEMFVQARLLLGGLWCGKVDGDIGPKTIQALRNAGCPDAIADVAGQRDQVHRVVAWVNQAGIGAPELEHL